MKLFSAILSSCIPLWLLLTTSQCSKQLTAVQYEYTEQRIHPNAISDTALTAMIQPYKDSLDRAMNVVLCISDTILTKSVPESDLGNMMCDMILNKSKVYCACEVDLTVLNNGGIRLPNLPKGEITLGKIVELMPFENQIDIMRVSGYTLDTLFNYMASKGGWQVSGASYTIKNNQAVDVYIGGQALDLRKYYSLSISDYLAQGGDNCTMLSHLPKKFLAQTLRTAIVDGLKEMNERGEHVKSVLEGRVKKAD